MQETFVNIGWESDNIDETYEEIDENILTR